MTEYVWYNPAGDQITVVLLSNGNWPSAEAWGFEFIGEL